MHYVLCTLYYILECFIRSMDKVQQNFFISAGAFVQGAGIAALTKAREVIDGQL